MQRLWSYFAVFLLPTALWGACAGEDIRPQLSEADRAEIAAAAQAEPFGTGLFWRAKRGDHMIDLIGTVHIDDPRLAPIVEDLRDEIEQADALFLEMTSPTKATLMARLGTEPELIFLQDGSLIDLLDAGDWAQLKAAAHARGIPSVMAARMQPWYLSIVLALPPCLLVDGQPPEGLDAQLEDLAGAASVPALDLEPADTLFSLFANEPLDVQLDFLRSALLDDGSSEDMLVTTLNTYFEGATAELWHLSRVAARQQISMPQAEVDALFASLTEALLVGRNEAWIPVLTNDTQQNVVAAFGAAHLFGERGVLRLLEQEGYAISPLEP